MLPKASNRCTKCNKSPNLVTLYVSKVFSRHVTTCTWFTEYFSKHNTDVMTTINLATTQKFTK